MDEEPNTTLSTPATSTGAQALGNDQSARNPDGSLKDNQAAPTTKPEAPTESKPGSPTSPPPTKPEAKPAEGAPETYAEFKAPEGFEIDKATLDQATPIFKELGLSQEGAQRLVDFYATVSKDAAESAYKQFEALQDQWREKVIKDPTLGDGRSNLKPEVQAVIGRAIDSLPPEVAKDFREALVLTGAGNNPAFVKAFYTLASMLGEGTLVKGGGPAPTGQVAPGAPRSAAQALFPNLPSNAR